ncbi:hypothetical protein SAMN03159353_10439 [Cedecea sp. NFIX57]|nr:hypothetical protein SAMN03159353_10439 [Cedecea sp. NFIX57]
MLKMTVTQQPEQKDIEPGRIEGIQFGEQCGIEKGEREAMLKIARTMLQNGIDSSMEIKMTGLMATTSRKSAINPSPGQPLSEYMDAELAWNTVAALSYLTFCTSVVFSLVRQGGTVGTPRAENLFLTCWLTCASGMRKDDVWAAGGVSDFA